MVRIRKESFGAGGLERLKKEAVTGGWARYC